MFLQQALETLQAPEHEQQKRQVIAAIKDLGLKVTCGDVAEKTALPVLRVNQLLNNVAWETQGHLAVDTTGGVTYKFAPSFESHYLINPSKHFFQWALRVAWNTVKMAFKLFILLTFLLLRISFGIILVASVVLVVVLIVAVIVGAIASLFKDSDSGGDWNLDLSGGSGSGGFDWIGGIRYCCFDWLWDWWYWGSYLRPDPYYGWGIWGRSSYSYGSDYYSSTWTPDITIYGGNEPVAEKPAERKSKSNSNFLDNCFAVLFGTADPNANWDTERWGVVARAIKAKSGVVLLEDVAPYLDATDKDEDCMLPLLVRFNGFPEVSGSGKLIYVFPAFMPENNVESAPVEAGGEGELQNVYKQFLTRQTVQKTSENHGAALPPYVGKSERALIGVDDDGGCMSVFLLAMVAIGGALWLLMQFGNVSYVQLARPALLAVAAYGGMFFLFPAMRWPFVAHENTLIAEENATRQEAAGKLAHPDALLSSWQREAAQMRMTLMSGEAKKIAYTTEKDALEQQFANTTQPNGDPLKLI